jgi:hypothetical protein
MRRALVLVASIVLSSLALAAAATAGNGKGPSNVCHQLPDTPCVRGHGGPKIGNKHCGPIWPCSRSRATSQK